MPISQSTRAKDKPTPRTLAEQVTERMREAILSGELRPGEVLRPEELAIAFGVSRVPIREALLRLGSQGLVKLKANRGATVAVLSPDEVEELFTIAATLERLASCRGIQRMDDAAFDRMRALLDAMRAAQGDPIKWYELNEEFHAEMYEASGWPRLIHMIEECRLNAARYITDSDLHKNEVESWHAEHVAIFEAARARDTARLDRLIEEHFARAIAKAKPYIQKKSPLQTDKEVLP